MATQQTGVVEQDFSTMLSASNKFDNVDMVRVTGKNYVGASYTNLADGSKQMMDPGSMVFHSLAIDDPVVTPTITSAAYDAATGTLSVTGTNMTAGEIIAVNKLTVTGEGGATYTLTSSNVAALSATAFNVTLNATDKTALDPIINKNGFISTGGTTFNLAAGDEWDSNVTVGNTADATNALSAANVAAPSITNATFNASTGVLNVTGTGFLSRVGLSNDIDVSKLTFVGEGGAIHTLTSPGVDITSGTSFTLVLNVADRAAVNQIANKIGANSTSGAAYNLAAAEDWATGAEAAVVVADATGNGVAVSSVATPTITSATYTAATGTLAFTGTGLSVLSGG